MSTPNGQSNESLSDGRTGPTDAGSRFDSVASDEQTEAEERIEQLRAENRHLREKYAHSKRTQNRQTALGLFGVGLVGVAASIAFPSARTVLLALGATGVFGAVLTYFLSPERLLPSAVDASTYAAVNETGSRIRDELGLTDRAVYTPVESAVTDSGAPIRLFVPQSAEYDVPSRSELRATFVAPDDDRGRGVSFTPTAATLLSEFERVAADGLSSDPAIIGDQLCDALVEQFELVRSARAEVDTAEQRATVGVEGVAYPAVTGFDHPVASFVGGGFAYGLDTSVTVETEGVEDGEWEYRIVARW